MWHFQFQPKKWFFKFFLAAKDSYALLIFDLWFMRKIDLIIFSPYHKNFQHPNRKNIIICVLK